MHSHDCIQRNAGMGQGWDKERGGSILTNAYVRLEGQVKGRKARGWDKESGESILMNASIEMEGRRNGKQGGGSSCRNASIKMEGQVIRNRRGCREAFARTLPSGLREGWRERKQFFNIQGKLTKHSSECFLYNGREEEAFV
jgi:hypothetical protein